MHAISEDLKFRIISFLLLETRESFKNAILKVINTYQKGGFVIKYIDVDRQFECLKDKINNADTDIYHLLDHINLIERSI